MQIRISVCIQNLVLNQEETFSSHHSAVLQHPVLLCTVFKMISNACHLQSMHADVLNSSSPLHHLFLRPGLRSAASNAQEDGFVLGDTRAQREGAHPYIPALIPPLSEHSRGPLPVSPRLVPAWMAGLMANRPALYVALQQNEPIDEATDWL